MKLLIAGFAGSDQTTDPAHDHVRRRATRDEADHGAFGRSDQNSPRAGNRRIECRLRIGSRDGVTSLKQADLRAAFSPPKPFEIRRFHDPPLADPNEQPPRYAYLYIAIAPDRSRGDALSLTYDGSIAPRSEHLKHAPQSDGRLSVTTTDPAICRTAGEPRGHEVDRVKDAYFVA